MKLARAAASFLWFLVACSPDPVTNTVTLAFSLDKAEDTIKSAIDHAKYSFDTSIFSAAQQGMLAIEEARRAYADSLDETTEALDKGTRDTLSRIEVLTSQIDGSIRDARTDGEDLLNQATNLVGAIPFMKDDLKISSVLPPFVVGGSPNDPQRKVFIEVRGSNLDYETSPLLVLLPAGGAPIEYPCVATSTQLRCEVEATSFPVEEEGDYLAIMTLKTKELDEGLFGSGFFRDPIEIDVPITTYVVPSQLGTLTVDFTVDAQQKVSRTRSRGNKIWSNSDTSDFNKTAFGYNADEGWKIDPESVQCVNKGGKKGYVRGPLNVGPTGFQCEAGAKGQGKFNGRGHQNFIARWREYRLDDVRIDTCKDTTSVSIAEVKLAVQAPDGAATIAATPAAAPQLFALASSVVHIPGWAKILAKAQAAERAKRNKKAGKPAPALVKEPIPECVPPFYGALLFNRPVVIPLPSDIQNIDSIISQLTIHAFDGADHIALNDKDIPRVARVSFHKDRILVEPVAGPPAK